MKKLITLIAIFLSVNSFAEPLAHNVDTRIGTASSPTAHLAGIGEQRGNTQPTAVVPFGMIQWGPDTTNPHSGSYNYSDKEIKGLSLTHLSGPGCTNATEVSSIGPSSYFIYSFRKYFSSFDPGCSLDQINGNRGIAGIWKGKSSQTRSFSRG